MVVGKADVGFCLVRLGIALKRALATRRVSRRTKTRGCGARCERFRRQVLSPACAQNLAIACTRPEKMLDVDVRLDCLRYRQGFKATLPALHPHKIRHSISQVVDSLSFLALALATGADIIRIIERLLLILNS